MKVGVTGGMAIAIVVEETMCERLSYVYKTEGSQNAQYCGDDFVFHVGSRVNRSRRYLLKTLRQENELVAIRYMKFDKLKGSFFERSTLQVAPDLLGKYLVRVGIDDRPVVGRIVEVEAYTGDDPAFHAWGIVDPPTGLVQPSGRGYDLFGPPGRSYIYLIYGMYWMLNVLTEREGVAGCVLIRALEPVAGESAIWARRPAARKPVDLMSGPGKLTQALAIDKSFHRRSLLEPPLFFAEPHGSEAFRIGTSSRIGITRAVDRQWRFFCQDNPFVSSGTPSDIAAERRRKSRRRTRRS